MKKANPISKKAFKALQLSRINLKQNVININVRLRSA